MNDEAMTDQLFGTFKELYETSLSEEERKRIRECVEWGAESQVYPYLEAIANLRRVEALIDLRVASKGGDGRDGVPRLAWGLTLRQDEAELLRSTWRQLEAIPGGFIDSLLDILDGEA